MAQPHRSLPHPGGITGQPVSKSGCGTIFDFDPSPVPSPSSTD